jgi:hypothetical protein
MLGTPARGLGVLALGLLRADFRFDFGADARFKLSALTNICFGPDPNFLFCL